MNQDRATELISDLAAELELVMKARSSAELARESIRLLEACMDQSSAPDDPDAALEEVLQSAIHRVPSDEDREALTRLFPSAPLSTWAPLHERGSNAADALGITYDALRRRNKDGVRRLDTLSKELARHVYDSSALGEILFGLPTPALAPAISEDAAERVSMFLSYARADDEHEGGVISQLRDRLVAEFRFQTGRDLFVFQDKVGIDLGEHWRTKIERELDRTSFLLVFLTPSYLRSAPCREELQRFFDREDEMKRSDLVLVVYYADVAPTEGDELAARLLQRQYLDWRPLRFEPFESVAVRRGLADLAASIGKAVSRTGQAAPAATPSGHPVEDEKGLLDRLTDMELALPRFPRKMQMMVVEQEGITAEFQQATEESDRLNRQGKGAAAKMIVARRLASRLEPYAERLNRLAHELRDDLDVIEAGLRALADELATSEEEGIDEVAEELLASLCLAREAGEQAASSVEGLTDTYNSVARTASTLRPVFITLTAANAIVAEWGPRFSSWVEMVQAARDKRLSLTASD